ncbi:ferredoxin [Kitasatospora sp. NPDC087314]|uniref:ferredoxin n=1 Tax=Kitasatospora sp. NPDC087314 TaxID=3364068 RepID=UPI003810302B
MRIELDTDKCQGHLRCMDLAPELFDCNDLGYGTLLSSGPIPEELEPVARRCAANCPERAIALHPVDIR